MSDIEMMLQNVDYKNVIRYFTEISAVPRGSHNNKGISDYLTAFAHRQGLRVVQDEALNVIIYKPASIGHENRPTVILQGHMDMVCVKTKESKHDFLNEGLELFTEDGMLGARGTSLGGDDGIALAYGMALLSDESLVHPALEMVFTTDEEIGMDGAAALDTSLLSGRVMLNCDSEDEGVILCSCAGGLRIDGTLPVQTEIISGVRVDINVRGLTGGHSGSEIDKNRTNACYLLGRILNSFVQRFQIIDISGGEKDNAIPSFASAGIVIESGGQRALLAELNVINTEIYDELSVTEPSVSIIATVDSEAEYEVFTEDAGRKILLALNIAPNGVQVMSSDIKGLVESSLNLGILEVNIKAVHFQYSLRSSRVSYLHYMRDKLVSLYEHLGGEAAAGAEYPAWEYKKESKLRELICSVFTKEYGYAPRFEAIHAGLECGILSGRLPDCDIISMGPNMKAIHSAAERLDIASSIRLYKLIEKLLIEI